MSGEPIPRQDCWQGADPWGHIRELAPQEQRGRRHRKEAVIPAGTHAQLIPVWRLELASPALPAQRCRSPGFPCTRPPGRGRQGDQPPGARHMDPHGPRGVLRWLLQVPRRLGVRDPAGLHAAAVSLRITWRPGRRHGGLGQEHRFAPRPRVPPRPWADDSHRDRGGLAVAPMVVTPVCLRPLRRLRRQPREPDHRRFPPLAIRRAALPMADPGDSRAARPPRARRRARPGSRRHGPVIVGRPHHPAPRLRQPPQGGARPQAPRQDDRVQARLASPMGPGRGPQGAGPARLVLLTRSPLDGQGPLRHGRDPEEPLPAVDRARARVPLAPRVLEAPRAGRRATARIACGRRPSGAIGQTSHPLAIDPSLGHGPQHPVAPGVQGAHVARHQGVGQGLRTQRPGRPLPLALGPPPWAAPLAAPRRCSSQAITPHACRQGQTSARPAPASSR